MFENPRRGRQARNFTTNVPKILDLKSSSEQIFSRKLSLGAPEMWITISFAVTCMLRSTTTQFVTEARRFVPKVTHVKP